MVINRLTRFDLWVEPQLIPGQHPSLTVPLAELTRWFHSLSPLFAPQELVAPVIAIEGCGRAKYKLGHYAHRAWRRAGQADARVDEVVMVAEYLNRDVFDIAETLVHEMVHLANWQAGIKDCTINQYHNKRFKTRAESVGLVVSQMPPRGFAETALSSPLREAVARLDPRPQAFELFRVGSQALSPVTPDRPSGPRPAKPKLVKYTCDCKGGVWLAAGRECRLFCVTCRRVVRRPSVLT